MVIAKTTLRTAECLFNCLDVTECPPSEKNKASDRKLLDLGYGEEIKKGNG